MPTIPDMYIVYLSSAPSQMFSHVCLISQPRKGVLREAVSHWSHREAEKDHPCSVVLHTDFLTLL